MPNLDPTLTKAIRTIAEWPQSDRDITAMWHDINFLIEIARAINNELKLQERTK